MDNKKTLVTTNRSELKRRAIKFLSAGRYRPGISNAEEMDAVTKYAVLTAFMFVGIVLFVPFTLVLAFTPGTSPSMIMIDAGFCIFLIFLLILSRTKVPFFVPAGLLVYAYTAFVCYMLLTHSSGGQSAALWSIILPPLAYFTLGTYGSISTFIVSGVMIFAFHREPDVYTYDFALRCAIMYVFTLAFASLTYKRTEVLTLALGRSRDMLLNEFDEVAVMKDNLTAGIFILDSSYEIQPHYSRYLNSIFNSEKLENVDFLSLLKFSLSARELMLFKDFLDMVLTSSHDSEILNEVNPLQKFQYLSESGEEKILTITFAQINRQSGEKVLLGVARDITYESQLEEKLAKEEQFRQNEMKSMFEVMHVSPQNLSEFLDEIDYEFARMNEALKDDTRPKLEVYKDLFQGMHAMKSNALVIGLESPAERFHEFEDKLDEMLKSKNESYESMLEIVFELERIMEIVDNLKKVVQRMEQFSDASKKASTSSNILVQAIRNTINKAKANDEKDAILQVKKLDWESINSEYRRVIKEIVLQFARNSLAHGIQTLAVRKAQGKKEVGLITLVVENRIEDNKIYIEYTDDGDGIDFEKIRALALSKKLISESVSSTDKGTLIKAMFSPGFSTAESLSMNAGRGIGLNLVSSRVKEYNGTISIKSSIKQGTQFTIAIPYKSA